MTASDSALKKKDLLLCAACGRRLKEERCIVGRDKRLTDGRRLPRYCYPGEGCNR